MQVYQPSFDPRFLQPGDYLSYGLPASQPGSNTDTLVAMASGMIDAYCGRVDGDGNGSLAYTTYQERIICQSGARNIYYLSKRPLTYVSPAAVAALQEADETVQGNFFYSGCLPNTLQLANGRQSCIISASGRQSYGRRGSAFRNDPFSLGAYISANGSLGLTTGPSQWYPLDITNIDYSEKTGELWLSDNAVWGMEFGEINITYNSGFNPLGNSPITSGMPRLIKQATAALFRNILVKGAGTTGLQAITNNRAGINMTMLPGLIDPNIQSMLESFVTIRVN